MRLDFNRSYQRFNSSFASWSSENGAVLFATESEDKRSVILTPSTELTPNTEYTLSVLAGAASASDGASSPRLIITFTTGLPDLGVGLEITVEGPWAPAKLVFDQDVDQESLRAALQWRVGETVTEVHVFPVLKIEDEVSVEGDDPWSANKLRRLRSALLGGSHIQAFVDRCTSDCPLGRFAFEGW